MNFSSLTFLSLFFPVSIVLFYLMMFFEKKFKVLKKLRLSDLLLILMSLVFYAWGDIRGAFVLIVLLLIIYIFSLLLSSLKNHSEKVQKTILALALIIPIVVLIHFKYSRWLNKIFFKELSFSLPVNTWTMLGISFIVFSAISYLIDIYRGDAKAKFIDAALYMTFFPKIISGPIVLYRDFAAQLKTRKYNPDKFVSGINLIIIGLAKKVILADSFGRVVAEIEKQGNSITAGIAWACLLLYTLQIYHDFSGYSDIAIGLAELFGISIKKNFDFPYTSLSVSEFWRRWHISLGSFLREYIYFPLGGSRKGRTRTYINLFIVFLISGIWHGTGFAYLFWGILHGVCVVIERMFRSKESDLYTKLKQSKPKYYAYAAVRWLITMCIVSLGWQFFRLNSFKAALKFFGMLIGFGLNDTTMFELPYFLTPKIILLIIIAVLGALFFKHDVFKKLYIRMNSGKYGFLLQEFALLFLLTVTYVSIVNSSYQPFIYFQY